MRDHAFNIAKNLKYDGYQEDLASMVHKFFDKKSVSLALSETLATRDKSAYGGAVKNENMSNLRRLDLAIRESAKELYKQIIRKFEKPKVLIFYR